VICVVCGFDNIEGLDTCDHCGADLRTVDVPTADTPFEKRMQAPVASLRPHPAPFVTADALVTDALGRMGEDAVDCVLVNEGGRLAGIFTERDAVLKLAGQTVEGVTVGEAMTADPVVLHPDDSIAAAVRTMAVGGFRHVPLVDGRGEATGVISAVDIFRYALAPR
jgi:CBS domain-containing protein